MPAEMMLGQPVVDAIIERCEQQSPVEATLAIIQVGDKPESTSYVRQAKKQAPMFPGLKLVHHQLPVSTAAEELRDLMHRLNNEPSISAYMLQQPLPPRLQDNIDDIRGWIAPEKDADPFGHRERGKLFGQKRPDQIVPCTPYAVMKMLDHYQVIVKGKVFVIVGDGQVGGLLKVMVGNDKGTQVVCNEFTPDLAHWTRQGDIVVGAAGRVPNLINAEMIKEGAVVVNVGMIDVAGHMKGDIHVESVQEKARLVTPVLKGLGRVTVAALMQNVLRLERARRMS